MDTEVTKNIRDRLTALNTKAYYLLVALAFIYIQSPRTPLLNWALTLTAAVAVLPVQDLVRRVFWLELIRALKIVCLGAALILTLCWAWSSNPVVAAGQKPAAAQPTEQQKPKESTGDLDSRIKAAQDTADRALMEKDYIERIQKEAKDYYDKAFLTQLAIVTIIGLFVAVAGKFGVDHVVQSKLTETTTTLREEFRKELAAELQKLKDSNAAQMNQLEKSLREQIGGLQEDLTLVSDWQFQFLQGMAAVADDRHSDSANSFRRAVAYYKLGKPKGIIERFAGDVSVANFVNALAKSAQNESERNERVRNELKREPLDGLLEDELNAAALTHTWLAPLLTERKTAPEEEKKK